MRKLVMAALSGPMLLAVTAAASAQISGTQTPVAPVPGTQAPAVVVPPLQTTPQAAPPPARNNTAAPVPSTRILGVPVTADAPVSPSYDGTAYKTLGGQAETDQDAISGQVMQPLDSGRPK